MQLQIFNSTEVQTMSSREIAELTGKLHKNVMRDIEVMFEQLGSSEELKFELLERINNLGLVVKDKYYLLNKEESICLVAGYDANVRMKIIKRWQELELQNQKPMSPMEMVIASAQQIMRLEQEQAQLKIAQQEQEKRLDELESKSDAVLSQSGFFSILGYANLKGIKITLSQASGFSRSLGSRCKKENILRHRTVDPRFGEVWIYPQELLEDFFTKKGLK